jgi:hypothetical protein
MRGVCIQNPLLAPLSPPTSIRICGDAGAYLNRLTAPKTGLDWQNMNPIHTVKKKRVERKVYEVLHWQCLSSKIPDLFFLCLLYLIRFWFVIAPSLILMSVCVNVIIFETPKLVPLANEEYYVKQCTVTSIQRETRCITMHDDFRSLRKNCEKRLSHSSFVMFVCLSFRKEQLGFISADFHEIWYLRILRKCVEKMHFVKIWQ